jgi:SAM-dependent methyltransferase
MSDREPAESQWKRIERYFGDSALEWQDLYSRPQRANDLVLANRRRVAVAKVEQHARPGARVLDAGCGAGLVAVDLVERGFFVHGVDIAQNMLDLAAQRFAAAGIARDRYTLARAEVSQAELPSGSFGAIVALGFLEYQEDELAALRRFHELLEPDGVLVASGPAAIKLANYFGLAPRIRERLQGLGVLKPSAPLRGLGLHRYTPSRFRELLDGSGFSMLEHHGHGFVEFEGISKRLSYDNEVALHRTLSLLARFLPIDRYGNDLIAVARKAARRPTSSSGN